jgi:hypothetical protein
MAMLNNQRVHRVAPISTEAFPKPFYPAREKIMFPIKLAIGKALNFVHFQTPNSITKYHEIRLHNSPIFG